MRIENWSGDWSFTPRRVLEPTSASEIAGIVRDAREVRVMGARHSWSKGIVTQDTLLSLDRMTRLVNVDQSAMQVTVQAGIRLKDLVVELEKHGLALANLGSIAEQSLAGALSTGTHGTGIGFRCLADQVQALKLIDGQGQERALDRSHPDFNAVVVGLGAFGVVHEMTLSVVPTFQMHFVTELMPFLEVIDNLEELVRGHDHFKFWWLVGDDQAIVFRQQRTQEPRNDSDFSRWLKDEVLGKGVYRSLLALQKVERERMVRLTNHVIGRSYGQRFERICKSHVAFLTPDPPLHRESELAFDFAGASQLMREYRDLLLRMGHSYSFIQEIRFTAADEFWASPAYGRESLWLSHYNIDTPPRWDDQLRRFLSFARDHDGRPHWGKEARFESAYLRQQYPKLDEFGALRRQYDPDNKLANRWLRQVLDIPGAATP